MKSKFFIVLSAILIINLFSNLVFASKEEQIKVFINQVEQKYDIHPVLHNNSVYVPLRPIFNSFQADFSYNNETKTITAIKGYTSIVLKLNETKAVVNGIELKLSQPPLVINNYTYVPLRFVGESFGAFVHWNKADMAVEILYNEQSFSKDDQSINTDNETEAFNELISLIEKYPDNIDNYAAYALLEKRDVYWLKYIMNNGADATLAIQYALVAGHIQGVQFLLENYKDQIDNIHKYNDYETLFSYTFPEADWDFYVYLNPNSVHYKLYKAKISLETSKQLINILSLHGLKPSSSDLVKAITNYPTVYINYLKYVLEAEADPNGTTTESVLLDETKNGIHFLSVGDMTFSSKLVPIIEIAYRVTSWNPSDYNLEKFSILVESGASLEPLSQQQLIRMQYLFEGKTQYEKLYNQITKLIINT